MRWYRVAARDLPWRRTRDPYAIWVSEIMLQQTRVDTVVPYYQRFMQRWPDVAALAAAELEEVLQAWSGLGYYSRARQLHRAAGEVMARFGGALPRDAAGLRALSGIGPYTAGAIASIAFGAREPLVDGNVVRVLSRSAGLDDDMRTGAGRAKVWARARELVQGPDPGALNQALMELGATVCTPKAPRCDVCPVRRRCASFAQGMTEARPRLGARRPPVAREVVAAVIARGDDVLLARRAPHGLFGGLWEPPMVDARGIAEAREALCRHGVPERAALRDAGRVRHVLTHRVMTVTVASGHAAARWRLPRRLPAPYEAAAWCHPDAVALSTLARKVLSRAGAGR